MTIASTTAKSGPYNGNGSTTVFNYGFKVFDEDDLVVTLLNAAGTEVVQTLTTHYTVTGVGNVSGGTIAMVTPPATGEQLVVTRAVPLLQGLDLQNRKAVTPELIERSLDLLTQIAQDLNERVSRSLKIDVFETVNLDQLLSNVNAVSALSAELVTLAGISTEIVAVAGDATDIGIVAALDTEIGALGAATTELLALYAIRTDISTVAADGADIGAVAGLSAEVAALAALSSELVALDAIIADISTVAGINSAVTTLAAISSSVSTLAAIAADVTAVAGISADVTAVAAIDSAVTSVAQLYQGASATNPTVRALDGSALQVGDFYLNTVTPAIRYVSSTGPVVWSELTTLIDETTLDTMGVTVTADEINIGAQAVENKIINGAFGFWQRGTSSSTGGYVAADRWRNTFIGGSVTQSRQGFSAGAGFGQNRPEYRLRQSVSGQTLASHLAVTQQRIEGVGAYNGQTVTVLGFARRHSGAGNMAVEMSQSFGSGGSPSSSVTGMGAQQITLTSDWEPFAAVIPVTSITGKTIGTNGDGYLGVGFWASAGSNFNAETASLGLQTIEIELWGIHIRVGTFSASAAWDYVAPDPGQEFRKCERFFQYLRVTRRGWSTVASPIVVNEGEERYRTAMRGVPAVATPIAGSSANVSSITVNDVTASGFRHAIVGSTTGDTYILNRTYSLDAEL